MPEKFPRFQMFTKALKLGMFGLSKRHVIMHLLPIFLHHHALEGLLHFTAKHHFHTLRRLSFRAIEMQQISPKLNGGCDWNTAFHFLADFSKTKSLKSLFVIFVNRSPKGFS